VGTGRAVSSTPIRRRAATPLSFEIGRALPGDRGAILEVMRTVNMHHIPSAEMEELDLERFFVARVSGRIVGAAGYKLLGPGRGKTTLLGVVPEFRGSGIGAALQDERLAEMHRAGVRTVTTNADRPQTIAWYQHRYGYRPIGRLRKLHEFGDPSASHWTTLELDLDRYMGRREHEAAGQRPGKGA
jgi:3-keto-5-aminohexanoate cleavage enzyme